MDIAYEKMVEDSVLMGVYIGDNVGRRIVYDYAIELCEDVGVSPLNAIRGTLLMMADKCLLPFDLINFQNTLDVFNYI